MNSPSIDILFVAYFFPPQGGPGVQRSLKFVRYLPEEGIRPVVVTGGGGAHGRWAPKDNSLSEEIPEDTLVFRGSREDFPPVITTRFHRWTGRPGPFAKWWRKTILEQGRIAASQCNPRALFVTLSPYESLAPALQLGRELNLPVIADLRDPWALDEGYLYTTAWHRRRERRAMGRSLAETDRTLMNTPEAAEAVRREFDQVDSGRVFCLTNGYDAADFDGLSTRAPDGKFRLSHTGYLHTELALNDARRQQVRRWIGGGECPVDFLGRSHAYLLKALKRMKDNGALTDFELVLAGVLSDADRELIEQSGVMEFITTPGYLDHREAVRLMMESDALFLPLYGLPEGRRARIVPGKTYEYLASGRPILAGLPEGDARDFIREANAGHIVDPDDIEGMGQALRRMMMQAPTARRDLNESVRRFERKRLAADLAKHCRDVIDSRK